MGLRDEISSETQKLKNMTLKNRAGYIWDYYRFHIAGIIAAVIFICVFVHDFRQGRRPVFLEMVVINSDLAYYNEDPISNDYIGYADVDTDAYNLRIDTGFVMSGDQSDRMTAINNEKLMAMFATGSVDAMLGPDSVINGYGAMNAFMDLTDVMPDELRKQLTDRGYELYYTTVYEEDGDGKMIPSGTALAGVYLDGSEYLDGLGDAGAFATQKAAGNRIVFAVTDCASNINNAFLMLKMLTGIQK